MNGVILLLLAALVGGGVVAWRRGTRMRSGSAGRRCCPLVGRPTPTDQAQPVVWAVDEAALIEPTDPDTTDPDTTAADTTSGLLDEKGPSRLWETAPPAEPVAEPATGSGRVTELIAAGVGRRRLSRELGVTEYEARRLLDRARPTTPHIPDHPAPNGSPAGAPLLNGTGVRS